MCATFDFLVFNLLWSLKINSVVSTVTGYMAGTVASFLINRKITFRVLDKPMRRLTLFFGTAILGSGISAALIFVGENLTNLNAPTLKIITLPIVAATQFLINKRITFSSKN